MKGPLLVLSLLIFAVLTFSFDQAFGQTRRVCANKTISQFRLALFCLVNERWVSKIAVLKGPKGDKGDPASKRHVFEVVRQDLWGVYPSYAATLEDGSSVCDTIGTAFQQRNDLVPVSQLPNPLYFTLPIQNPLEVRL